MKLGRMFVVLGLAILAVAAAPPRRPDWNGVVAVTPQGGYRVGNPNARVKLVEYVSYTCPHCAHFTVEAEAPLRDRFVATGQGSIEYRPFVRNRIDIAAALIATCGPASKFPGNHTLILQRQEQWLRGGSEGEQTSDFGAAMRSIAADYKLYELIAPRGYTRAQLDTCLGNRAAADRLAKQTQFAVTQLKVSGTPSFLIDGRLQDVHDWNGLRPLLPIR